LIAHFCPGLNHLVFALKYGVLDLDIFRKVFRHIPPQEIADFGAPPPPEDSPATSGFGMRH